MGHKHDGGGGDDEHDGGGDDDEHDDGGGDDDDAHDHPISLSQSL